MTSLAINTNLPLKSTQSWLHLSLIIFKNNYLPFLLLQMIISVCIFLPFMSMFLVPLLIGKFILCTQKIVDKKPLYIQFILTKLFNNYFLTKLAFIAFCLNLVILLSQYLIQNKFFATLALDSAIYSYLTVLLIIPTLILNLSLWLSPAICVLNNDIAPKDAMLISLKASFKNICPLLIYMLTIIIVTLIIATPIIAINLWLWSYFHNLWLLIPFAVIGYTLLMCWGAILNISTYFIYQNIFNF